MHTEAYTLRKSTLTDIEKIFALYRSVAKNEGGIARAAEEISLSYVENFSKKAHLNGAQFVITDPQKVDAIIGEIHTYQLEPKAFGHVLSELTIVIDPGYQGLGLGRQLFNKLLTHVSEERPDIFRIELITRESNSRAIKLYEGLGFKIEGRLEGRIKSSAFNFEADIPMAWFNENFTSASS